MLHGWLQILAKLQKEKLLELTVVEQLLLRPALKAPSPKAPSGQAMLKRLNAQAIERWPPPEQCQQKSGIKKVETKVIVGSYRSQVASPWVTGLQRVLMRQR